MERKTFYIPNISCAHCVNTIKNELEELEGITRVEGNPDKKEISVDWESPATLDGIRKLLDEINYPPED